MKTWTDQNRIRLFFSGKKPRENFLDQDQIGVFCQCVLLYTKPPGKTSTPPLDVPLFAGEVHDIVKSICRISRKNLASGQTQQNFSFIQAAKGKRSGEMRRKRTADRDTEIVGRVLSGESMRSAAREFGLALSTVHNIVARRVFDEPKQDDLARRERV